jgi:hypothetical protein
MLRTYRIILVIFGFIEDVGKDILSGNRDPSFWLEDHLAHLGGKKEEQPGFVISRETGARSFLWQKSTDELWYPRNSAHLGTLHLMNIELQVLFMHPARKPGGEPVGRATKG